MEENAEKKMEEVKAVYKALEDDKEREMKTLREGVKAAYTALDEKFGTDIVILDISEISVLADYFLIASGNNPNQLQALADAAEEQLFKLGIKLKHKEGSQTSTWMLMDFGSIIIHIFNKDDRGFYNLERIWGDAMALKPEDL